MYYMQGPSREANGINQDICKYAYNLIDNWKVKLETYAQVGWNHVAISKLAYSRNTYQMRHEITDEWMSGDLNEVYENKAVKDPIFHE